MKALTFSFFTILAISSFAQFGPPIYLAHDLWCDMQIKTADMDGDGDVDVLYSQQETTYGDTRLLWFENVGDGEFGQAYVISRSDPGVQGYRGIHPVDIDNDGDIDVLAALQEEDKILLFENAGTGMNWVEHTVSSEVDGAYRVVSADLDNDGDEDVISASILDNKIAWYENLGNNEFGPQAILSVNALYPRGVISADVNNDGWTDVISVSYDDGKVALYRNLGDASFGPEEIIAEDVGSALAVEVFDADLDGDLDVIWSSTSDQVTSWQANDGEGNFGEPTLLVEKGSYLQCVDMDDDGDEDVLLQTAYGPQYGTVFGWMENLGNAEFELHESEDDQNKNTYYAADLDGDNLPEVITSVDYWGFCNFTIALQNSGNGEFSGQNLVAYTVRKSESMLAFDADGDGDKDIALISLDQYINSQSDWVYLHENLGNGVFGPRQTIHNIGRRPKAMGQGDFDGDGDIDFAVAAALWDDVEVYENTGDAEFTHFTITEWPTNSTPQYLDTGDLNGDGLDDIVAVGYKVEWYTLQGDSIWIAELIDEQHDCDWVSVGDLDGDNDSDVLVTSEQAGIFWYENDGAGNMQAASFIAQGDTAYSAVGADLNSDGLPDVLSKWGDGGIRWYENLGGGIFGAEQTIATGATFSPEVSAGDVDGDGDLDVISSGSDADLVWYENDGNGVFNTEAVIVTGPHNLRRLLLEDLDGDSIPDVLFCSHSKVGWCRNQTDGIPGCIDPEACNYSAEATFNDNSCYYDPCFSPADYNEDGEVDIIDLLEFLGGLGCVEPPDCPGDLDGDGIVSILDLLLFLGMLGTDWP